MSSTQLTCDDFHFCSMQTTENITRYVSGGYHPIAIGDVLGPLTTPERGYRIVHKLGYGSYGTVWLAQKTDSSGLFVAVKVTTAESNLWRECVMLETACTGAEGSHILTLLDHFTLRGPNGIHYVLVMDVVIPLLPLLSFKFTPLWRKSVAFNLVKAVVQLHAKRIVHGDLHLGNIGIAFPELADQNADDVMQDLDAYDLTVVLPTLPVRKSPSLPPYVVAPCNIAKYYTSIVSSEPHPQTRIFDFGNGELHFPDFTQPVGDARCHESRTQPLSSLCALEACAPEVVFARIVGNIDNPPVEFPADIWALGAAIYKIVAGSSLYVDRGLSALLCQAVVMAGSLPPEWQTWFSSLTHPPPISPSGADTWWESRREVLGQNCVDETDTDALIAFLRRVLVLDPASRPTATDILQDRWFKSLKLQ